MIRNATCLDEIGREGENEWVYRPCFADRSGRAISFSDPGPGSTRAGNRLAAELPDDEDDGAR